MWCPKCRNEYIAGITRCADCGVELVESLPQKKNFTMENISQETADFNEKNLANDFVKQNDNPNDQRPEILFNEPEEIVSRTYVSKRDKKDDISSTAYTFTIVGAIGVILLLLCLFGIIPIGISGYMKIMGSIVMGGMFLVFLVIGIRSFQQLKGMDEVIASEEKAFKEITDWFRTAYTKEDLTAQYTEMDQPDEQLYFIRYEWMSRLLKEKYPDLDESFLDHIIETLYPEYFS